MQTYVLAMLFTLVIPSVGAQCRTQAHIFEKLRHGQNVLLLKNMTARPIVGYVVAIGSGESSKVYSGTFSNGDLVIIKGVFELGPLPRNAKHQIPVIDYVRLSDGTSCGLASTNEARNIVARFKR
jgi:hypothetical protein